MESPESPHSSPRLEPPKVYRAMRRNLNDDLPIVGSGSSSELGAREGIDISVDASRRVVLDGTGMSVAPNWRDLPFTRIPRRLRDRVPGATGSNSLSCFKRGMGPFAAGPIAEGPVLVPDDDVPPIVHGVISPAEAVPYEQYQAALASTRNDWQIDEA